MDDKKVTKRDIGNNFFLPFDSEGQNRADVLVDNLLEMNPWSYDQTDKAWDGVRGRGIVKNPDNFAVSDLKPEEKWLDALKIEGGARFFDLVILNNQRESTVVKVTGLCEKHGIKYLV